MNGGGQGIKKREKGNREANEGGRQAEESEEKDGDKEGRCHSHMTQWEWDWGERYSKEKGKRTKLEHWLKDVAPWCSHKIPFSILKLLSGLGPSWL